MHLQKSSINLLCFAVRTLLQDYWFLASTGHSLSFSIVLLFLSIASEAMVTSDTWTSYSWAVKLGFNLFHFKMICMNENLHRLQFVWILFVWRLITLSHSYYTLLSQVKSVRYGVPQGSVLLPLLVDIYMLVFRQEICCYVDDMVIYVA